MATRVTRDLRDPMDPLEALDQQVLAVHLDPWDSRENREKSVTKDQWVPLVLMVQLVTLAQWVQQARVDQQDHAERRESSDQLALKDQQATRVLREPRAILDQKDPTDLRENREFRAHRALRVAGENRENPVLLADRVLLERWALMDQLDCQELLAPQVSLELVDHPVQLARKVAVDSRVA